MLVFSCGDEKTGGLGTHAMGLGDCLNLAQGCALWIKLSRTQPGTCPAIWDQIEGTGNRAMVQGTLGERSSTGAT